MKLIIIIFLFLHNIPLYSFMDAFDLGDLLKFSVWTEPRELFDFIFGGITFWMH